MGCAVVELSIPIAKCMVMTVGRFGGHDDLRSQVSLYMYNAKLFSCGRVMYTCMLVHCPNLL